MEAENTAVRKKRSEMTAEERKQYNKEAARRSRAKRAIASGEASFSVMVSSWTRHEAQLKKENPTVHSVFQKQHEVIELAEQELADIRLASQGILAWEDVCDPLITLKDIREHSTQGSLNYREVESAMKGGEWPQLPQPTDELNQLRHRKSLEGNKAAEIYKTYGFRIVLDSDSFPDAEKFAAQFQKDHPAPRSSAEGTDEGHNAI